MKSNIYKPALTVLYVEDEEAIRKDFYEKLIEKNITTVCVDNLAEAVNVLKKCKISILISDGMFPRKAGMKNDKCFIPLVEKAKQLNKNTEIIAWSNSTHVHEYCKQKNILSYSKEIISKERFKERNRKYIKVEKISSSDLAEIVEDKIVKRLKFEEITKKIKLESHYNEPATILGVFMAADTRTKLFQETAGKNYSAIVSKIENGMFDMLWDTKNDAQIAKLIADKIIKKNFFPVVKRNIDLKSKKLLTFAKTFKTQNLKKCSNDELAKKYLTFCKFFEEMRMYSSMPTALEHSAGKWTDILTKILEKKTKNKEEINRALSVLTTPEKFSYLKNFEFRLLKIAMQKNRGNNIEKEFKKLKDDFEWVNYAFEGEKLTLEDVYEKVKNLISAGLLEEKIVEMQAYIEKVKVEKKQIIDQYKISKKDQRWFNIGADIVFIKYFRKGVFAESYYLVEFLLEEIGRRIGCSRKQVSNMLNSEVLAALKIGKFDGRLIDLRLKNSILFHDAGMTYAMPLGASKYLKVKTELGGELVMGQVAFIGRAEGIVKIVNVPVDMEKMNKGDILVSRSTNPSLLSAMQKSAAFITDIGGLTCHAAIIAREMKKPCIVGTKFATQILKDGMFVEVDANRGIVRVINR